MMDTLGTNRKAQIILDNNKCSRTFNLGTGRPQGDCPSPLQFNGGEQILLFKIELDSRIVSVYSTMNIPRNLFPVNYELIHPNFRHESNGETDKTDGLADDTSVIHLMERQSLSALKDVLNEFSIISGLKCNFNKTHVMHIGNLEGDSSFVEELGFSKVIQLTLLGFIIDCNGLRTEDIFNNVSRSIARIITMWDRYQLSLPGRINIFKTLLLSQVSYPGSICSPSSEKVAELQGMMNNYVLSGLKVSSDRIYLAADSGGLGLINLMDFLAGLQAAWIKKAYDSTRDNWRVDLHSLTFGNCLTANSRTADPFRHPILNLFCSRFEDFTKNFYLLNDNHLDSYILNNSAIKRSRIGASFIDPNFLSGNVPVLDMGRISKLKVKDFFRAGNFKSLDELSDDQYPFQLSYLYAAPGSFNVIQGTVPEPPLRWF
jgi:hypothetical protein